MESDASFAVPGGESAELFQAVEAAFDAVSQLVQGAIVGALHLAVDLGRDDGFCAHSLNGGNDGGRVVATVCHDDLGLAAGQQRQGFGKLARLTAGQPESDGLAQSVGEQVDLGAQSTSGTPQSLVFAPFLRPVAAC